MQGAQPSRGAPALPMRCETRRLSSIPCEGTVGTLLPQVPADIYLVTKAGQANPAHLLHCCRPKPHLSSSCLWEGKESQGVSAGSSSLLEFSSPSCCPCAPHQSESPPLPAWCPRLWLGHCAVVPCSSCTRLPALPAPACTSSACLPPGTSLGCSRGHLGQSSGRNEHTKVYRINQKTQQP